MRVKQNIRVCRISDAAPVGGREFCELALEAARLGTWEFDPDSRSVAVDVRMRSIYGISKQELSYEELIHRIIYSEDAKAVDAAFRQAQNAASGGRLNLEHRVAWADGSIHWVAIKGQAYFDAPGRAVTRLVGIAMDIDDRKLAEQQLKRINEALETSAAEREALANRRSEQLKLITAELIQTEQQQRQKLAQVLHDQLQPTIVAARLHVEVLKRHLRDGGLQGDAQQVTKLLDESLEISRLLTSELSPPVLRSGSFAAALRWLAGRMFEKHGLEVVVQADERINPEDDEIRTLLFQSLKELLFNVVKHANVSRAFVRLRRGNRPGELQLTVSDEGTGFEPRRSLRSATGGGTGLASIRERLEMLGGRSQVASAPGKGTRVTIVSPLNIRRTCCFQ